MCPLKQLGETNTCQPTGVPPDPILGLLVPMWQRTQPGLIQGLALVPLGQQPGRKGGTSCLMKEQPRHLSQSNEEPLWAASVVWQCLLSGPRLPHLDLVVDLQDQQEQEVFRGGPAGTSSILTFHASCLIFAAWWRVSATLINDSDLQRSSQPWREGSIHHAVPRGLPANARPSRTPLALSWVPVAAPTPPDPGAPLLLHLI